MKFTQIPNDTFKNIQMNMLALGNAGENAVVTSALIQKGMSAAAGVVSDFASESLESGQRFESAMSQVAATMGKTVDEVNSDIIKYKVGAEEYEGSLSDLAKTLGSKTAFSASQAAEALNYMALAGYDAEKSARMLPTVLNLAAAGGMDLARASDMVTDAASALGLAEADAVVMVDQMAASASNSNTSVSQLGEAMLTIGGLARNMAGGTEELSTVLGVLADNGIKGSEAGMLDGNFFFRPHQC